MAKDKKSTKRPTTTAGKTANPNAKAAEQRVQHHLPKKWQVWAKRLAPSALIAIALVFIGIRLLSTESEVLFKSQELNLWIADRTFINMYTIYPGGWLSWVASYMTQYFYHPATGVWMLMAAWAIIVALTGQLFKLKGWRLLMAFAVPLMLLACFTQTGYWLYYQKLHGQLWVPTLGVLVSLAGAIGFMLLNGGKKEEEKGLGLTQGFFGLVFRISWMLFFAWFGYTLIGAWSFLGLALMATNSLLGIKNKENLLVCILPAVLAGVLIWLVPRLAYNWMFEQTQIDEIYRAGLPCFNYSHADVSIYRRAYYLLALSFLPLIVSQWVPMLKSKKMKWMGAVVIGLILYFSVSVVTDRWNTDKNFHTEIRMANCISQQDWNGALDAIQATRSDTIEPTRVMVMMKNLSLFRLGKIGDEMFLYPEGARMPNIDESYKYGDKMYTYPDEVNDMPEGEEKESKKAEHQWMIRITQVAGKMLYYNSGKLNFSYRWCMEDGVEFGWRVEELKIMALCCMLKGEDAAARKFFNILKKTKFHKEWAERYEPLIGHPDKMKEDPELTQICYLKEYGNRLDADNTMVELYLMNTFANGNGADPIYQEMTLVNALQMKDIDLFWPRFSRYASLHSQEKDFHMPRYYQEAAYLYCMLEPQRPSILGNNMTNAEALKAFPFDESVKKKYDEFMQFNAQMNGQIRQQVDRDWEQRRVQLNEQLKTASAADREEKLKDFNAKVDQDFTNRMNKAFKPMYGDTFYFFYYLVRGQKTN